RGQADCGHRPKAPGGKSNPKHNRAPLDQLTLSGVHDPQTGRRITFAELEALKKAGACYNCFKTGHHSAVCPEPRKPNRDGRVKPDGTLEYTN
ncbi:MAG: hypothetical protein ACK5PF_09415, partial [bacterium]